MEQEKLNSLIERLDEVRPNHEGCAEVVSEICEQYGGKLEVIASLKEAGNDLHKEMVQKVLGVKETSYKPVFRDGCEYIFKDGCTYELDTASKTIKKVKDKPLTIADVKVAEIMPLSIYRQALKDRFNEDAPIKKGKLHFRDYVICCDREEGFYIEDAKNGYERIDLPFDGIPTPKELADFFKPRKRSHTPEELAEAVRLGKELREKSFSEAREALFGKNVEEQREKVLALLNSVDETPDPLELKKMITGCRSWSIRVGKAVKSWQEGKIRLPKLLSKIREATEDDSVFHPEQEEKTEKYGGELLPDFDSVGELIGDEIEVDGELIPAVPFLAKCLLHEEPKCAGRLVSYFRGEITYKELLKYPLSNDGVGKFSIREFENSERNAQVLCMVFEKIGLYPPQDILYESDLEVGDRIMLMFNGSEVYRTVTDTDCGVLLGGGVGLTKYDKWVKVE